MDVATLLDFAIRPQDETRLYSRLWMDELATTHADGLWLMGVWQRSAAGRQISLGDPNVLVEGRRLFSDFQPRMFQDLPIPSPSIAWIENWEVLTGLPRRAGN